MKRHGLTARETYPGGSDTPQVRHRPEATRAAYPHLPAPATGVRRRLHPAHPRHLRGPDDRLAVVPPPPLPHRADPVLRLDPPGPPQPLPPLRQPRRLVARRPGLLPGPAAGPPVRPPGPDRAGRRRYLVPPARPDRLRRRHALRPAAVQP